MRIGPLDLGVQLPELRVPEIRVPDIQVPEIRLPEIRVRDQIRVPEQVRRVRDWLGDRDGRTTRRISVQGDRAQIEVRGAGDPRHGSLGRAVKSALERLEGVEWAEVDANLGRAVLLFDPAAIELDDIVDAIEETEEAHDSSGERFPHHRPDHPDDLEPVQRRAVAIAADVIGLGLVAAGQSLRLAHVPAEIPGLVSLADSQPRLRGLLERRIGPPATDVVVAGANAIAQALGQGAIGLTVDIAQHSSRIGEQLARRAAWRRRHSELVEGPHSVRHSVAVLEPRPVPLPRGDIERYSDGAALASLAAVGATFGITRNPRRAADLVLAGMPKAATLGRETFAAALTWSLSAHDVLVMDPAALRRLDRVDTLVVDARLVVSGRWSIDRVHPVDGGPSAARCEVRARSLFKPTEPAAVGRHRSWSLQPWRPDARAPRGTDADARRMRRGGRKVLGLWHGERLQALISVQEDPAPMAEQLVDSARKAGLTVILAGGADATAERLGGLERWAATRVVDDIRVAQAGGSVVMYASGRAHAGLRASDVGIGVIHPGRRVPTGADLILHQGLGHAWLLLDAVVRARSVSRRSALLAAAGATTGSAWALAGSGRFAASRILLAVNAASVTAMANGTLAGLSTMRTAIPRPPTAHRWHELDPDQVLEVVASVPDGLEPADQEERRLAETARPEPRRPGLAVAVWEELANPLTPVLAAGAALSAAVGSLTDAGLVMGVVGINAGVGAIQRLRTERALAELEDGEVAAVHVLVAGQAVAVAADTLVVGDVVLLHAGEAVPADCRVLAADSLEVDESSLTGESQLVIKGVDVTPGVQVAERSCMLYEGTVIASGEAMAVVVAVGADTEVGRSAAAASDPPPSGVEQRLQRLTDITIPVTVGAGALVTGIGFLFRRPTRESVSSGVSLMVAAVPEGLPAVATLAQVASAHRLARRNALVRNPRAIEALGRVQQVCFDKTGTLTEGRLAVALVSDGQNEERPDALTAAGRRVLRTARWATPAANGHGTMPHATDRAVHEAALAAGLDDDTTGWSRITDLPFESRRALHAVLGRHRRSLHVAVKGAPETVLPLCHTWHRGGVDGPLDAVRRR